MGAILPNGRTAIPADVGNEAAFALMYSQSRVVMARDSQLTDAAAPMLLASSAAAIDVEGTAMTWGPNESVNNDQSIIRNLLNLSRTHVNDASLKNGLPFAAREIRFSDTQIGDEGVRALSDNTTPYHRYWSVIALDGTQITDGCEESLKQLMLLPHMKRINLRKTRLSGDVIERLRKVSPLVELVWDEPETRSSSE